MITFVANSVLFNLISLELGDLFDVTFNCLNDLEFFLRDYTVCLLEGLLLFSIVDVCKPYRSFEESCVLSLHWCFTVSEESSKEAFACALDSARNGHCSEGRVNYLDAMLVVKVLEISWVKLAIVFFSTSRCAIMPNFDVDTVWRL